MILPLAYRTLDSDRQVLCPPGLPLLLLLLSHFSRV